MSLPRFPGTKTSFLVFPSALLFVALLGGFFLTRLLERTGMEYLRDQSEKVMETMIAGIQSEMRFPQVAVSAMAGSPWVVPVFLDQNSANVKNANSVLDRYNTNFEFSVCYLLDVQGNVIAASNRNMADSFLGKNYAFRPYFREALQGKRSFYMAAGVTSQERGFYAAHSVKDGQGKIVGVAVIKQSIEGNRNTLSGYRNSFFISPDGVVFISGSKDMVFKTLWPLDSERVRAIKDSRQFMEGSFSPVFFKPLQDEQRVWFRGEAYQSFRKPLGPPGWSLVLLASLKSVFYFIFFGWILTAFMICVILILTAWAFLRIKNEELLRKSEEKYRSLFLNSRDAIMVLRPPSWNFISGNPATIEMFRTETEEKFRSLGPWDLSPETQPDGRISSEKSREMIETAVREGFNFFEWTHKRFDGEEFPATVLLTRIGQGREMTLLATVRDITRQKQAEEEVNMKVEELERFNRIAVGRELKMIELKEKLKALEEGKK
jgi:PAS domain S-box-containing protein